MTKFEKRKKVLFFILKENKFCFSDRICNFSFPIVQRYIEKEFQKKISLPFPDAVVRTLKKELRKLKYAYDKIK